MAAKSGAFRSAREEKVKRSIPVARPAETAAAANFDRLIHERTRLAIVSALAVNTSLTFNELKQLLGASDGNLSVHARKLEDAGYIACTKSFSGRLPCAREISGPHGGPDSRHARGLVAISTLERRTISSVLKHGLNLSEIQSS
jgi:DNA-binding transcriptional ArsR family regulator